MTLKITKESKVLPQLIYLVEQFDRALIQYDKKSKANLVRFVKVKSMLCHTQFD